MFGQQLGRSGRRAGQAWGRTVLRQQLEQRRWYAEAPRESRPSTASRAGRGVGLLLYGAALAGLGAAGSWYAMAQQLKGFSDADSLSRFVPATEQQQRIEEAINKLPLVAELRAKPEFSESRPHLKMAPAVARQSLTGGTLQGAGRLVVPPYVWVEEGGKSLVCVGYAGSEVCGYPGKLHGGFLATMLDEGLARCCYAALPQKIAMTARLEIDYRRPGEAEGLFVLRARTTRVEGRKAWVEGWVETVPGGQGEDKPVILAEAKALFVSPKFAAVLPRILD